MLIYLVMMPTGKYVVQALRVMFEIAVLQSADILVLSGVFLCEKRISQIFEVQCGSLSHRGLSVDRVMR
jgi:hypothetical protein